MIHKDIYLNSECELVGLKDYSVYKVFIQSCKIIRIIEQKCGLAAYNFFFDENGNRLGGYGGVSENGHRIVNQLVDVPENTSYLLVSVESNLFKIQVDGVNSIYPRYFRVENDLNLLIKNLYINKPFILVSNSFINGKFIYENHELYNVYRLYIPEGSKKLKVNKQKCGILAQNLFNDIYGHVLNSYQGAGKENGWIITNTEYEIPNETYNIDLSVESNVLDIEIDGVRISLGGNELLSKNVAFLGDSITQQGHYVKSFSDLTGCTCINYGVSGSRIAKSPTQVNNVSFEERVDSMSDDVDIVVVFGGTNDFGHSSEHPFNGQTAPFGKFLNGTSNELTFCAGCHRMMSKLYNKYKDKKLFIMTPLHHGNTIDTREYIVNDDGTMTEGINSTSGKTMLEYVEMIKKIAAYYSIEVLDAYSESMLNPIVNPSDFSDGLHLNSQGGLKLAQWMYNKIISILKR